MILIRFGYYHVYPYNLFACDCMKSFKNCLKRVDNEESREVARLFFDVVNMKCSKKVKKTTCKKYSKWFDQCLDEETTTKIVLDSVN